jgi:hypothetical protein
MHPWETEPDGNSAAGPRSDLGPAHLLMAVTMAEGAHSHRVHLDTRFCASEIITIANSLLFAYFPLLTFCVIKNTLHPLMLFGCVRLCCHTGLGSMNIQALWHFFVLNKPPSPKKGLGKKKQVNEISTLSAYPSTFWLMNLMTKFHVIWYEINAITGHPITFFNFLQSVVTTWQTCKLVRWQWYQ